MAINLDNKLTAMGIQISKTFDFVLHDILLIKLEQYEIRVSA